MCVGRLKTPYWREACAVYEKRLSRFRRLQVTEVKDAASDDRVQVETGRLLEALPSSDRLIVLDERGKDLTSPGLAALLDKGDALGQGHMSFVIGGPFGLDQSVRDRAWFLLRLSALTLPHELARVLLMEQLYRAECLRNHVPYHH